MSATTTISVEIDVALLERVMRYATSRRLQRDALIASALTLSVPMEPGGTATPQILELDSRARYFAEMSLRPRKEDYDLAMGDGPTIVQTDQGDTYKV